MVACFASNVARLSSAAAAAAANDRQAALVGRSLWRIEHAARETGYLEGVAPFLTDEEAAYLPRDKVLLICTGSQGEPRSALARIADDDHPEIVLEEGDTVIFSSRIIPGNERAIGRLQNKLAGLGVEIFNAPDAPIHVSGHPAQDELTRMYQMVRPKIALPVHGETRHLLAQAKLAEQCQVPQTVVTRNGEMIKLAPGPAMAIGLVATLYGISLTIFNFIPIAENLSTLNSEDYAARKMILEGLLMIKRKIHPILVEEKMKSYLLPTERNKLL